MSCFIDTNVFIRFWEGNSRAVKFIKKLQEGSKTYYLPSVVVDEVVWVLSSFYKVDKKEIVRFVKMLVQTSQIKICFDHNILKALQLYEKKSITFGDCLIIGYMQEGDEIVSFDKDFDKIEGIKRIEI